MSAADKKILIETPLACASGSTTPVSLVLGFLATMLRAVDPAELLSLNYDDCCGLAHLLDTCATALDEMPCPGCSEGGE